MKSDKRCTRRVCDWIESGSYDIYERRQRRGREKKDTHAGAVDGTAPRRAAANRQQCGHHRRATQPEGGGNARADKTRGKQRGGRQSGGSRRDSIRAVTLKRGGSSQDIVGDVRAGAGTFDDSSGILVPEYESKVLVKLR